MLKLRSHLLIVAATGLLWGCSFIDNDITPLFTGEEPTDEDQGTSSASGTGAAPETVAIPPSAAETGAAPGSPAAPAAAPGNYTTAPPAAPPAVGTTNYTPAPAAPPAVGTGNYTPAPVTPGAATGTYVGQKVANLRGDLTRLQTNINQHNQELQTARTQMASDAAAYYNLVATISSRLQVGTTPGNPQLLAQWNQAQAALDRVGADITRLNSISNEAASDSALAAYILESVRAAYSLQGAVDEDHRQLNILENDVNRTVVLIDRLLNDLSGDISRQTAYVTNERRNLTVLSLAIKNGELYGQSLANRAFSTAAPQQTASSRPVAGGQPLMVIRFDRANVSYDQALYSAVSRALERRPGAVFSVVAVAPASGTAGQVALNSTSAKRNAESVVRTLTDMGLPADRISISATTSATAQSNEVQVYVR
ncbi:MAG TPA: hypothetical protein VLX09_17680 [Stellaceae bacterium]|nr:hypothetical protein [Stellaceae bacterium]